MLKYQAERQQLPHYFIYDNLWWILSLKDPFGPGSGPDPSRANTGNQDKKE